MSHEVFIRNIRELFPLLADTEFTLHYTRRSRNVVPLPEDHQSPQGIRDLLGRTYRGQIVVVPRSEIPLVRVFIVITKFIANRLQKMLTLSKCK